MVVSGAAAMVTLGVLGTLLAMKPPRCEPEPPPPPPPSEPVVPRERAWKLTKQAAAAARASQCKIVDADFHATVFVRDAASARCLATPALAPTPSIHVVPLRVNT